MPDVLLEAVRREASRAREFRAERLVELDAVHRAHERADQLRDEGAVAGMAPIARREELHLGSADRPDQFGHALGGRRRPGGIDHDERLACVSSAAANSARSAVFLPGNP